MIAFLQRIDRMWARLEGALTVVVLILMVLTAGLQAGVRNLTRFDLEWANQLLTSLDWADSLLRKGTLWLAFLGASLATYHYKQIAIDSLLRLAPARAKYSMLGLSTLMAGMITFGLSYAFGSAVNLNMSERPVEYELLSEAGPIHVCDATAAQLREVTDLSKPRVFCAFRSGLRAFGFGAETPGATFQLIVPVMFFVIALRLIGQGVGYVRVVLGGQVAIEAAEAEEHARLLKQQESVQKSLPPAGDHS